MEKVKILFVGALTLDTLFMTDGFSKGPGKYLAKDVVSMASGMATNAATAAVRLDGEADLWASVGDDETGKKLISEITLEGVGCDYIHPVLQGRTAQATIIVDEAGERWVLADYDPVTQVPPSPDMLPDIRQYHAVMADVRWPGAARLALQQARKAGLCAVLDADVASAEVLENLAHYATHIVASASGAEILSGLSDLGQATIKIARDYECFACVTNGAAGALWALPNMAKPHHIPTPDVEVMDTNGAGDVFHGAFTLALAEGHSPKKAVRFAGAAAALKCTVLGGRLGAPNRQKTLELMKETYYDSL